MVLPRGERVPGPQPMTGDISVKPPPHLPRPTAVNPVARLMPVVTVIATLGMMVFYLSAAGTAGRNPMFALFPLMMLGSLVGTMAQNGRGGKRTTELNADRREYLSHLASVDQQAAIASAAQQLASQWHHPEPDSLWALVGGDRMWERRPMDTDFGQVRVGVATARLATPISVGRPSEPGDVDPVAEDALRTMIDVRSAVPGLPVVVGLMGTAVAVTGETTRARAMLRATLCQLAVFHSPEDVRLVSIVDDAGAAHWDWLKWLPHHQDPARCDAGGPQRLTFHSFVDLVGVWPTAPAPQVVLLVDGGVMAESISGQWSAAVTVIRVGASGVHSPAVTLHLDDRGLTVASGGRLQHGLPDAMTEAEAATTARRMARYIDAGPAAAQSVQLREWPSLVGIGEPGAFDVAAQWRPQAPGRRLRVPIGLAGDGSVVELDIKEAAEGGVGPHGLCVGATGSGKSELLRTLVLGLVTRHPPDVLNLVLVDFKGGATFLGLEQLAHVAAVITNLADEAPLVARMKDALTGEMYRRQELLRAAGHAGVADYERDRSSGARLQPLPALFIVVDEFSELLSQHPDLAELFAAIGRVGRSLRMHLLLASQRLDEGRMRGLESHLSYRLCLKTFSAGESRAAIGVPDAYELPSTPGTGYLRLGAGELIRFDAAYVSGPHRGPAEVATPAEDTPRLFTAAPMPTSHTGERPPAGPESTATVLQTVVERLQGNGAPAHRVWLPPLGASQALSSVLVPTPAPPGCLQPVAIGVVDRPLEQRRSPLVVDVAGSAGHVAIVGAPQSGKSTSVRTLLTALAMTHDPGHVQFYCLDFGGGALSALRDMPHVGVVATRSQAELVRRTVAALEAVVGQREKAFVACGVDSIADYRRRRAGGDPAVSADPYGDVFLVVDGWASLRRDFEDLEAVITALASRGLSLGVHIVVTALRWAELRPALKDQIGTKIELRLGDPADSEMDRKQARLVADVPGRGVTREGLLTALALPRLDGLSTAEGLGEAADAVSAAALRRWGDRRAPQVRLLPAVVELAEVPEAAAGELVLGLSEHELRTATITFAEHPHLIVIGDSACGKTATLRAICTALNAVTAMVMLVDVRRTLLEVVDTAHLLGYAMSPAAVRTHLPRLLEPLTARLPGPDVSQRQLRDRSWWSGPELYLVVDDYDLIATAEGNPLAPIAEFLPHARDIGLHVIVARRSGGAARAMYEPVLSRLRETGAMGLLMSTSPEEGMLWSPVRPSPLPPGRGTLVTRSGAEQVQVLWTPP